VARLAGVLVPFFTAFLSAIAIHLHRHAHRVYILP
jgi:hypothetical protein